MGCYRGQGMADAGRSSCFVKELSNCCYYHAVKNVFLIFFLFLLDFVLILNRVEGLPIRTYIFYFAALAVEISLSSSLVYSHSGFTSRQENVYYFGQPFDLTNHINPINVSLQ